MPASTIRTSTSGSREAGPIVATIFVRRIIGSARYTPRRAGRVDNVSAMSIETEDELEGLRRAGHVVAVVLRELRRRVQAGVSTAELDRVAGRVFARHGARSAPKLVYGAPCEVFISVNDEAVHGVPGPRRLRRGDLVKLDVTAELDGFYADACVSVAVRARGAARAAADVGRRRRARARHGRRGRGRAGARDQRGGRARGRRARRVGARRARRARDRAHDPRAAVGAERARSGRRRRACTPAS